MSYKYKQSKKGTSLDDVTTSKKKTVRSHPLRSTSADDTNGRKQNAGSSLSKMEKAAKVHCELITKNPGEEWEKRVDGLRALKALFESNADSPNDTSVWTKALFNILVRPIEGQVVDLRSNITKEVGALLVELAKSAKDAAGPFFLNIQPSLFLTLNSGNKVICGHLDDALCEVWKYTRTRKYLAGMVKELQETKSVQLRTLLAKHIVIILNHWSAKYLTKDSIMLVKATEKCLNDGNVNVRATGREAYAVLQKLFPAEAGGLYTRLNSRAKKSLEEAVDVNVDLTQEKEVNKIGKANIHDDEGKEEEEEDSNTNPRKFRRRTAPANEDTLETVAREHMGSNSSMKRGNSGGGSSKKLTSGGSNNTQENKTRASPVKNHKSSNVSKKLVEVSSDTLKQEKRQEDIKVIAEVNDDVSSLATTGSPLAESKKSISHTPVVKMSPIPLRMRLPTEEQILLGMGEGAPISHPRASKLVAKEDMLSNIEEDGESVIAEPKHAQREDEKGVGMEENFKMMSSFMDSPRRRSGSGSSGGGSVKRDRTIRPQPRRRSSENLDLSSKSPTHRRKDSTKVTKSPTRRRSSNDVISKSSNSSKNAIRRFDSDDDTITKNHKSKKTESSSSSSDASNKKVTKVTTSTCSDEDGTKKTTITTTTTTTTTTQTPIAAPALIPVPPPAIKKLKKRDAMETAIALAKARELMMFRVEDPIAFDFVTKKISLQPYGTLGQRLLYNGKIINVGDDPCHRDDITSVPLLSRMNSKTSGRKSLTSNPTICVVDAAGLHHIQPPGSPKKASGSAAALYKWLGIDHDDVGFPHEVIKSVKKVGDAKFHIYHRDGTNDKVTARNKVAYRNSKASRDSFGEMFINTDNTLDYDFTSSFSGSAYVIHAVGPDFRVHEASVSMKTQLAIDDLSKTYHSILVEFIYSGTMILRLLPISGGVFAGPFLSQIPSLTFQALQTAFRALSEAEQSALLKLEVHLCIFSEADISLFMKAGFSQGNIYHTSASPPRSATSTIVNRGGAATTDASYGGTTTLATASDSTIATSTMISRSPSNNSTMLYSQNSHSGLSELGSGDNMNFDGNSRSPSNSRSPISNACNEETDILFHKFKHAASMDPDTHQTQQEILLAGMKVDAREWMEKNVSRSLNHSGSSETSDCVGDVPSPTSMKGATSPEDLVAMRARAALLKVLREKCDLSMKKSDKSASLSLPPSQSTKNTSNIKDSDIILKELEKQRSYIQLLESVIVLGDFPVPDKLSTQETKTSQGGGKKSGSSPSQPCSIM